MDATLALSLALSGVIGLSLGVFGGGGSILAVPVLVYVTHIAPGAAVGMSLAIVGTTSLAASIVHHRRGCVRIPVALLFGGAGVVTAFFGARLTRMVSPRALMLAFALLMIVVGAAMIRRPRTPLPVLPVETNPHVRWIRALLAGAGVGAVTGFLGVGGGFLVVPALMAFTGLEMREAVGTSLLVIAINSAAGFLGHLGGNAMDIGLVAGLTALAVLGALVGERAARNFPVEKLRRGFAVFVVLVGVAVALSSGLSGRMA